MQQVRKQLVLSVCASSSTRANEVEKRRGNTAAIARTGGLKGAR